EAGDAGVVPTNPPGKLQKPRRLGRSGGELKRRMRVGAEDAEDVGLKGGQVRASNRRRERAPEGHTSPGAGELPAVAMLWANCGVAELVDKDVRGSRPITDDRRDEDLGRPIGTETRGMALPDRSGCSAGREADGHSNGRRQRQVDCLEPRTDPLNEH